MSAPYPYDPPGLSGTIERLIDAVVSRGDLAHLALLAWALAATGFAFLLMREAQAASRRFDDFVRELARFNRRLSGDER